MHCEQLDHAIAFHQKGRLEDAIKLYRETLLIHSKNIDANRLLSLALHESGQLEKAIAQAKHCIALQPKNIALHLNMANFLFDAQDYNSVLDTLQQVLKLDRRNADAHLLTGDTYQALKNYPMAIESYNRALKLDRGIPEVYNNLANALMAENEHQYFEQAVNHYKKAILIRDNYTDARINLGNAYLKRQLPQQALEYYQYVVTHFPTCYQAYTSMAKACLQLKDNSQARLLYERALEIIPKDSTEDRAKIFLNIGNIHHDNKAYPEAIECYDHSLQLKPLHLPTLRNLASALNEAGLAELARQTYHTIAAKGDALFVDYFQASMCFPVIYDSLHLIEEWRARYSAELDLLLEQATKKAQPPGASLIPNTNHFYLAYQGKQDRILNEKLSILYQAIFAPHLTPVTQTSSKSPSEKISIGFISKFLDREHTIKKLTQGIIQSLTRDKFQITVFSVSASTQTALKVQELCTHDSDQYYSLSYHQGQKAVNTIQNCKLDILFYTDIGMEPFTYWLAHHRLATTQCVTWGHPVTTGIPTIDYFISSKLIEPENPQENYSETLVQLNQLPALYKKPQQRSTGIYNRSAFQLPEQANIYLCPQSLYKIHPDFDMILQGILSSDQNGIIVFICHTSPEVNQQLLNRLEKNLTPENFKRIAMLPHLSQEQFQQLLCCATVMLDPLHFGGGNTNYEAFAVGLPVITQPGSLMRGRIALGCYKQMEIADCIATSPEEYIRLAVNVGSNPELREQIHQTILQQQHLLFDNQRVIQELEAFFSITVQQHRLKQFQQSASPNFAGETL